MSRSFYGYMRVSDIEQNGEQQQVELMKWGIVQKNIYADKLLGNDFSLPNYQSLRKKMQAGDVLVVKSIGYLGRNYEEIQSQWRYLVKEKGADIVIMNLPILDTRTNKDLIGTLISDIVLQLLSYVAQTEREYMGQAEGTANARGKGVHLGRVAKEAPTGFESSYQLWRSKAISFHEMAQRLAITEVQLRWLVRKRSAEEDK